MLQSGVYTTPSMSEMAIFNQLPPFVYVFGSRGLICCNPRCGIIWGREGLAMKLLLLISLLFATCVMSQQAPNPNSPDGQIKGKVLDEDGNPVSGAAVYLLEQGLSIQN